MPRSNDDLHLPTSGQRPPFNHIRLREIEPADLPTFYVQQLDPDANRMAVVLPRGPEAFEAHWAKILGDRGVIARAIIVDGVLTGQISCFKLEGQDAVGYWIAKEYWGRGIGTRALSLLLEAVPTRPLYARAARHNAASIRVLTRCGFELIGYKHSPADGRYPECEEALFVLK
jgi:RimJ/RimL family protein N-acetyltransferase